jgi:hypothetical protein
MITWWQGAILVVLASWPSIAMWAGRLVAAYQAGRARWLEEQEPEPTIMQEPRRSVPSVLVEQPDEQETLLIPATVGHPAPVTVPRFTPEEPQWQLWFTTGTTTVTVHRADCPKVAHARVNHGAEARPWRGHPDDSEEAETAAVANGFAICHRCEPFKVVPRR